MKEAWQFHYDDRGAYLELNHGMLLSAETWLQAESKHGGAR
jgi:hypothetical protein